MFEPKLSVVIPVFNNLATLPRVLGLLKKQRADVPHEVVAVDNGSTDDSLNFLRAKQKEKPEYLTVLFEEKRGAGAARNKGARAAKSPLLLFLGGDIIPANDLLLRHHEAHQRLPDKNVGCLGFVTWDPLLPPTSFMVFLEHGGPQNAFGEIAGQVFVDPARYFYGSNISLKKETFLAANGFDMMSFSGYGWEDLELGMRLKEKAFRLFYEPQARSWHHHKVSLATVEKRMFEVGKNYVLLKKKYPQAGVIDLTRERKKYWVRRVIYNDFVCWVMKIIATWCEERFVVARLYRLVLSLPFYSGVHFATVKQEESVDKNNE